MTSSKSRPSPSTNCLNQSESPKVSGPSERHYVSPQGFPRASEKFQIIHLGTITAPREPIDTKEAQIALEEATNAIQQIGVVMQTLTTVATQISQMMNPG